MAPASPRRHHRLICCTIASLAFGIAAAVPGDSFAAAAQAGPAPAALCREWHECRDLAVAAAERGEFETFHDLAWRAVQTGPRNDRDLMYLLARAQSLSGRPHDALVMLERLAALGAVTDAATNDDFRRVRQLPGWPDLEARIDALSHHDAAAAPAAGPAAPPRHEARRSTASRDRSASPPSAGSPLPPTPAPSALPPTAAATPPAPAPELSAPAPAAPASETLAPSLSRDRSLPRVVTLPAPSAGVRFPTNDFAVSGLAYDAHSGRFVLGDRHGRKLIVVDERSSHPVDLVRAQSAGFLDVTALEIDGTRGDLWVASADNGDSTLHRLQLVSGRPLRSFQVPPAQQPARLVDLAVTASGTVAALDATSPRLFVLRPGASSLEALMHLDALDPISITAPGDSVAYVADRDGVVRVDLRARTSARVAAPKGVTLTHLERIRWHSGSLIAVQADDQGRRILRLEMNAKATAIVRASTLEMSPPASGQTFVTTSGEDLVYVTADAGEFAVYRVPLR